MKQEHVTPAVQRDAPSSGSPSTGAGSTGSEPSPAERIAQLFSLHADFVWRSLRGLGVPDADAEDAAQEVFLIVYRRLADYEDRGLLRAWLFSISRQVASHYRRGASRADRRHRALIADTADHDVEELLARREAPGWSPCAARPARRCPRPGRSVPRPPSRFPFFGSRAPHLRRFRPLSPA
jgi:RNA polymerase sigma factor (sigma-70 family)